MAPAASTGSFLHRRRSRALGHGGWVPPSSDLLLGAAVVLVAMLAIGALLWLRINAEEKVVPEATSVRSAIVG